MKSLLQRWRGLSCDQVMEVLQAYLDGEIDSSEARKVATHLDRCGDCGLESDVYRQIKVSLARIDRPLDPIVLDSLQAYGDRLARGEIS